MSVAYVGNKGTDILAAMELKPGHLRPGRHDGATPTAAGRTPACPPWRLPRRTSGPTTIRCRSPPTSGVARAHDPLDVRLRPRQGQQLVHHTRAPAPTRGARRTRTSTTRGGLRHPAQVQPVGRVRPSEQDVATGLAKALLNDWQVNGIMILRSGLPITVLSGTDVRSLPSAATTPIWSGTPRRRPARTSCCGSPGRLRAGGGGPSARPSATRCAVRGEGDRRRHLQELPIGSRAKFQFRVEAFNVFKRRQLQQPELDIHRGRELRRITGAADPRVLQFGFKFIY